jgi:tRNA(fMet)-specific endonuclease VapC
MRKSRPFRGRGRTGRPLNVARLYLLDTNILSHLVRQPQGVVAERIDAVGEANVFTTVIVACELRYGAAKRGSRRLTRQVEAVLGALTIRPLESKVERVYASIRVALEKKGTPIGAHDMLITAHARALDAVCVTDDLAEFKRVQALKVENWLS